MLFQHKHIFMCFVFVSLFSFCIADGFAQSREGESYGTCRVPTQVTEERCSGSSGFLCVNTPEGGVATDHLILRGKIDQQEAVLGSLGIRFQHDYTKSITTVDTDHPQESCEVDPERAKPFCLDPEGTFAAFLVLPDFGPYTIVVSSTRFSGKSEKRTVVTSRVKPFSLSRERITFDPDILHSSTPLDVSHVKVTLSFLEEGCAFCDVIGASTGGLEVTISNRIHDAQGMKQIDCVTSVQQDGIGKFVLEVPVLPGKNELTIHACNAATKENCSHVDGIIFEGADVAQPFQIESPPPLPAYSASAYPTLPFAFRLVTEAKCVNIKLNQTDLGCLEPQNTGLYQTELLPQVGVNVVLIETDHEQHSWVFGWGDIQSPFVPGKQTLDVPSALSFEIPTTTMTNLFLPIANNYLRSDEFQQTLTTLMQNFGEETKTETALPVSIPGCDQKSLEGFTIALRTPPHLDAAKIQTLLFSSNKMNFTLNVDNLQVGIDLIRDENQDGIPDYSPLPLNIGFKKALFDLELRTEKDEAGNGRYLLASPFTDCVYKREAACLRRPASLIPQRFVGNAGRLGHFVACDVDVAHDDIKDACRSLNTINAQTGGVSEKVLDALNGALYCQGSSFLTRLFRDGMDHSSFAGVHFPFSISLNNGVSLNEKRIRLDATLRVGNQSWFDTFSRALKIPSVGMITTPGVIGSVPANLSEARMISMELSANSLNALLFALSNKLHVDLHEPLFEKLGFSFVELCDRAKEKDTLCALRPRVSELLGTSLVSYGYDVEDGNHPLMVRIEMNQALSPRVQILDETQVQLQIGGLRTTFFALEVDKEAGRDSFGNWKIKLDEAGNPLIRPVVKNGKENHIIAFELTLLLPLHLGSLETNPEDSSKLALTITPRGKEATFLLTPLASTNTTTIPSESLVLQLRQTLQFALALFSGETGFPISLPKRTSLFSVLGLSEIEWGADGLLFELDDDHQKMSSALDFMLLQMLHEKGEKKEYQLP